MKAIRIHAPGSPEALRFEEMADPKPGPGEVTLEVKAASVNHLDIWVRKGLPGVKYPVVPGSDAAGVVRETGQRVCLIPATSCGTCEFCASGEMPFCLGYRVWGEHRDGSHCTVMAVPATSVVPIPDSLPFERAAAAPLVFVTAWRMLVTRGRLKAGEDVLIWSAGAGVGTACVQIARAAGARVIATASSDAKCARLSEIGADIVLNHARENVVERVRGITAKRGVDVVADYIGKETWARSLQCLRRGGRLVTCGATSGHDAAQDLRQIFYRQLEVIGCTLGNTRELLDALKLVFSGRVNPVVDAVLPLRDAAEAHRRLESRQVFGKLVLVP